MDKIREKLNEIIKNLYNLDFDAEVTPSPDNIDADYSTNAPLKLAKLLHKPPMVIAEELMGVWGCNDEMFKNNVFEEHNRRRGDCGATEPRDGGREGAFRENIILNITPPGFLNFTLSDDYLSLNIDALAANFKDSIALDKYAGQTIICEFSDPNPFKVLHVGHLYTSVVGDALSRLYEYAGAKVIRANFGGDVGLHVAKTMYALQQKDTANLKIEDIAKCYIEGTALYDEDEQAHAEITKLNKEIYKINAENLHNTPLAELYWRGRELSYAYFNDFYSKIGVKFDKYYPESTVAALGLETVKRELANGVYENSDGAVIFNGDKYGLHTRVFINKEGVPTYEAKDVGLIFTKWQDYHFDRSIVITGNEQLDYMKVVLKSVEQYAPELVAKTTHLTHGLVKLPGGVKMSSRKGNFLKAVDVLEMVADELKSEYNSTDTRVSLAATNYAFLKYKMGGDIIFDPKESVKMTGNSGPYLLYSAVRAKKILANVGTKDIKNGLLANVRDDGSGIASEPRDGGRERSGSQEPIMMPSMREQGGERDAIFELSRRDPESDTNAVLMLSERELIKKLLEYKPTLSEAVTELAPHKVASYLYELAQAFSRFYENCPVAGSDREAERLKLVQVYLSTMTHGLGLLGIEIPEEM